MTLTRQELMDYLLKEQGFEEDVVKKLPVDEMMDLYEMYHED